MAHFYVNTIVFLTVQQTIAVPRQRKTQCEQWNNEGFFFFSSLLLPGGKKKTKPPRSLQNKYNKKNLAWYNCFLRLWFGYVKCYFFRGGDGMRTQSVCVSFARQHMGVAYTWKHTGACIHGEHQPAPPVVVCFSVYVDRDQRWVLKHFRPLLSPQP